MQSTLTGEVADNLGLDQGDVNSVIAEFALQLHRRAVGYKGVNGDFIGESLWHEVNSQAFYHLLGFLDYFADRYSWEPGSSGEYLMRLAPTAHWMPFRHQLEGWQFAQSSRKNTTQDLVRNGIPPDETTDEAQEPALYAFDPDASSVIIAARKLVWRLASSPLCVKASEVITIGKLFRVLQRLPEVTLGENLRLGLSGPKRMFGNREITHFWEIRLEDSGLLVISSSGHFYRPETGGDSFTTMMWQVSPGDEPDENSYLHLHQIVDDADNFENEVAAMDFTEPGYSLEVEDDSLEDWAADENEDTDYNDK